MKLLGLLIASLAIGCGGTAMNSGGDGGVTDGDMATGPMVTVTGTVEDSTGNTTKPLSGATVTILGTQASTKTAADGSFTLMAPTGATIFVSAAATSYLNGEMGAVVPAGGGPLGKVDMIPSALITQVAMSLSPMLTYDTSKGIVSLKFQVSDSSTGYGAMLSASHGMTFAASDSGGMYATTTDGQASLIFPNVTTGTTTVTLTSPAGKTCTLAQAITNWQVAAGTLLQIRANCQ